MKSHFTTLLFFATAFFCQAQNGTWITRATLPNMLTEHTSTALNGKVYLIGGLETGAVTVDKVQVYDPATDFWTLAAPLPQPRHHAGVAVANGRIYVLGGYTGNPFAPTNTVYEYDPQVNTWATKTPMPTTRGSAIAATVNGQIYVIGGAAHHLQNTMATNERYDPATDTWTTLAPMPTPRDHHAVVAIDSMLYAIGGRNLGIMQDRYKVVEAYNVNQNAWTAKAQMLQARGGLEQRW